MGVGDATVSVLTPVGYSGVYFDGINDYLKTGVISETIKALSIVFFNEIVYNKASVADRIIGFDEGNNNGLAFGPVTGSLTDEIITFENAGDKYAYTSASAEIATGLHTLDFLWTGSEYSITLDGTPLTVTKIGESQPFTLNEYLYIAKRGGAGGQFFDGKISSIKMWKNTDKKSENILIDLVAVKLQSTKYSTTPAPSNCMWNRTTKEYLENEGAGTLPYVIGNDTVEEQIEANYTGANDIFLMAPAGLGNEQVVLSHIEEA